MQTPGQRLFIREAISLDGEVLQALNDRDTSIVIETIKHIRKTAPDVPTRLAKLRELARKTEARAKKICTRCHKSLIPGGDPCHCD
jgi:hypothetical protein